MIIETTKAKKKWKSLSVDEEIYNMISELQAKFTLENNGVPVRISDITESAILAGIDKVELINGKVDIKKE